MRLSMATKLLHCLALNIPLRRVYFGALLALSFAVPAFAAGGRNAADRNHNNIPDKVDKALAGELKDGAATHKVIITFKPGYRAAAKQALLQRRGIGNARD